MSITCLHRQTILYPLISILVALYASAAIAADLAVISVNELKLILDDPDIAIIDVRSSNDWQSSDVKIKGAIRGAPKNFESWAFDFSRDKRLILY